MTPVALYKGNHALRATNNNPACCNRKLFHGIFVENRKRSMEGSVQPVNLQKTPCAVPGRLEP